VGRRGFTLLVSISVVSNFSYSVIFPGPLVQFGYILPVLTPLNFSEFAGKGTGLWVEARKQFSAPHIERESPRSVEYAVFFARQACSSQLPSSTCHTTFRLSAVSFSFFCHIHSAVLLCDGRSLSVHFIYVVIHIFGAGWVLHWLLSLTSLFLLKLNPRPMNLIFSCL
jgi:hypothetical protein